MAYPPYLDLQNACQVPLTSMARMHPNAGLKVGFLKICSTSYSIDQRRDVMNNIV